MLMPRAQLLELLAVTFLFHIWWLVIRREGGVVAVEDLPLGQRVLPPGLEQPRQRILNTLGGFYSQNVTLYFRNSPYRVQSELIVESGATLTIETGVQIYFDTGVGMKVFGTIRAIGNEWAHIQMLPYQEQLSYDHAFPDFRLIDGPSVRQGRLQVKFRDRWRSVCTKVTNWTSVDTGTACRSMGYTDGGFWRFFRRNNDTYPFVMPTPGCPPSARSLWECEGLADPNAIPLAENLCQGDDDLGLYCWGPPSFTGWAKHWKGLQIYSSPFDYVHADPDAVAVQRESRSRLEFIDLLYAGYDRLTQNTTAALYVEGVPPLMNGLRVQHSARDGIYFYEPSGPIIIANSTVSRNRGHGIAIDNTLDGRFYLNQSIVEGNYGDGVWYREKHADMSMMQNFLGWEIGGGGGAKAANDWEWRVTEERRTKRQTTYYEKDKARVDMCVDHKLPPNHYFPHLVKAHLQNGTVIDPISPPTVCWLHVSLPPRLRYSYTIQFVSVSNRNSPRTGARTELLVCEGNASFANMCQEERYRIPLWDGVLPQSVVLPNNGRPMYVGLEHGVVAGVEGAAAPLSYVAGDVDVLFKIHATVTDKAFYGLNITNSVVLNNTGNGIQAMNVRERTALCNVSVDGNEGLAGLLVRDGAADIWINDTSLSHNWGDGVNISYAGGAINLNTSRLVGNRWRGFAVHYNTSGPFYPLHQQVVIKGRPANNLFYPKMLIAENLWGGVLIGNVCTPVGRGIAPKVLINWVEFNNNHYHPAVEVFSCQRHDWMNGEERDFLDWRQPMALTTVDISGNSFLGGTGMGLRIEPCVNAHLEINSNRFHHLQNAAMLVRNAKHPQLGQLEARVTIAKNDIKMNTGQFIVSLGLNEDAPRQRLVFNQQNELRGNTVINPFPFLKPRSTPYAALVVSSSNVVIRQNCFSNPHADYELGVELSEHAKRIDARENNWGHSQPQSFMHRIFDQFNRYSLAAVGIDPFSAVCNQRQPVTTYVQQYFRQFRHAAQPFVIGGSIYENSDLGPGRYTVVDDLHVTPGAKLTLSGATLEFQPGIGMLVQGELLRSDYTSAPFLPILFTSKVFTLPKLENIRLLDESGNEDVLEGRLEVRLADGQWGTVCNRSWTAQHAQLACNQLGLTMDPEHFENWRIFPSPGDLPIRVDNIRCEEREYQLADCRHDGPLHNVQSSLNCRPTEVVGLRCAQPYWAGVRYSLLASPPTITGQSTMQNWVVEKAGLYDFRIPRFAPALQLDWNYHTFTGLTVRDNYYDGLDIIYNDLTKKPAIRNSYFGRNRRNGVVVRSVGLTMEHVTMEGNENAGLRYNPQVEHSTQRDIVSWLERSEQPELEANNVIIIPNQKVSTVEVHESQLNHRVFLVAKATDCQPMTHPPDLNTCSYELNLRASGKQYGMDSKLVVQLVNRAHNESDEEAIFVDRRTGRRWSTRHHTIDFPITSSGPQLLMQYRRSRGPPSLVILVLYLDAQEYLDRFLHVYHSVVRGNQYGVSAQHYSNLTFSHDSTYLNRWSEEKIWFQKTNFTGNKEAVVWIHSPQHAVVDGTPIAEITWHIDNCSIHHNHGPVIETHRDLYASANVFHWNFWSNTFANNSNSGVNVQLPDTYDLLARREHSFLMTENRFEHNSNFLIQLNGYYAFTNISSNNFTDNWAPVGFGLLEMVGMEKYLVMEKNRFFNNWGRWMVRIETLSQSLRSEDREVPAYIQYNYFQFNRYLRPRVEEYVDMWPRSFAVGVFGSQLVDIHFNRLRNVLLDFEVVAGCKPQLPALCTRMNVTHNWWGVANEAEVGQRLFDFDDWNIYTLADFSPYYTTEEQFINFWWWRPSIGQLSYSNYTEPDAHDLKGRMYESKRLALEPERWYPFPYHYRPFRPYRITRDLTIMPGATLTIERNVEVHVWPNVRILVLGHLVADGTLWQPIRFKPINTTELAESQGRIGSRYKRSASWGRYRARSKRHDLESRYLHYVRTTAAGSSRRRAPRRAGDDDVFRQFPALRRDNPYFQPFDSLLSQNGTHRGRSGFLQFHNATTGEIVPSCDRFFTLRNAQVVCRELGYPTQNAYHWLTPRYDYNPQVRILKTYVEPRQCRGTEARLDRCELRLSAPESNWQCMGTLHFNYIHCGSNRSLSEEYIGNWGGITFAHASLEPEGSEDTTAAGDASVLRHVEIVGAGHPHNDSLQSGALQIIRRSPILENVNVTNSSLHALQIVGPSNNLILARLNVSDNRGQGISVVSTNLQSAHGSSPTPIGPLNLPYQLAGMLDVCSAGKAVRVEGRVLLFYKYDSYAVDCVKVFRSAQGRKLGFRFLQVNLYGATTGLGRSDHLSIFAGSSFFPATLLHRFTAESDYQLGVVATQSSVLSLHMRATAADGEYGFLAEVSTLPSPPIGKNVDEIAVRNSRILNNDRGAMDYRNVGDVGPNVIVEQWYLNTRMDGASFKHFRALPHSFSSVENNGYWLFGNLTTSLHAMEFHLHNTMLLLFRANSLRHNRGGLLVSASSASSVARLNVVIKSCAFTYNSNGTTLHLRGNSYQQLHALNNVVAGNVALYHDTARVEAVSANFTRNLFSHNIGLHTLDTKVEGRPFNSFSDATTLERNYFEHNLALGHGNQYEETFGMQPERENDEFKNRRPKRQVRIAVQSNPNTASTAKVQVLTQHGISFDWWTHVGREVERFRSTLLAGSANFRIHQNLFNDPLNDYELVTSPQSQYDTGHIDARWNYWGFPGTPGVAAGKIRDQSDYAYLTLVDFQPVLESNTSLIEGDCPGGWFQIGNEEFKSCFLFFGASMTYAAAVDFCQEMGAFMPILRDNDVRQRQIAQRVDQLGQLYITEVERYNSYGLSYDIPIWISSVTLPSNQCGWISSRTASIGEQNCNNLLPFVCERGTQPYQEPLMWRRDVIAIVVVIALLVLVLLCLGLCSCRKSQKRKEGFAKRKDFIRDSIRRSRDEAQKQKAHDAQHYFPQTRNPTLPKPSSSAALAAYDDEGRGESRSGSSMTKTTSSSSPTTSSPSSKQSRSSGSKTPARPYYGTPSSATKRPGPFSIAATQSRLATDSYHNPLFQYPTTGEGMVNGPSSLPSLGKTQLSLRPDPLPAAAAVADLSTASSSNFSSRSTATSTGTSTCTACCNSPSCRRGDVADSTSTSLMSSSFSSSTSTSHVCSNRHCHHAYRAKRRGMSSDRASTITEESTVVGTGAGGEDDASSRSLSSDSTVTTPSANRPLLPSAAGSGRLARDHTLLPTSNSLSPLRASSRPDLSTQRSTLSDSHRWAGDTSLPMVPPLSLEALESDRPVLAARHRRHPSLPDAVLADSEDAYANLDVYQHPTFPTSTTGYIPLRPLPPRRQGGRGGAPPALRPNAAPPNLSITTAGGEDALQEKRAERTSITPLETSM